MLSFTTLKTYPKFYSELLSFLKWQFLLPEYGLIVWFRQHLKVYLLKELLKYNDKISMETLTPKRHFWRFWSRDCRGSSLQHLVNSKKLLVDSAKQTSNRSYYEISKAKSLINYVPHCPNGAQHCPRGSDLTRSEGAASRTAASPSPYHILAQGLNTGLLLNHILATARFSFPTKIF